MLREDNTRTGFFEEREFRAILKNLPEDLRPVFEVAFAKGKPFSLTLWTSVPKEPVLRGEWCLPSTPR
jgi:hypothetical protein